MTERLGAKFTLDITDLKSGITAANKLIAQNEAAFRADAAEMDDWGKTEEGLKKRIDTLNKNIDLQKGKVSALIEERKRIIEEGKKQGKTEEEIASSVDKLNKKITSEEKTLEKMRSEVEKNEKSLDGLNKEQEESAKASEKAAGGFTIAKGALASLAADGIKLALSGLKKLASALVNAGQNADNLNTLSKQTGFSTEELQKFEYAADLVDVSVSDITGAVRKLKKNVTVESGDVAEAFAKIGVSVKDDAGEFRDINEIFYDVLEGLSKVGNETERDTLAMSIFGKGADELAGIIDDGGKALKDYGKEAEDLGIIISGETLDAANDFNDSIDKIKATGKGAFAVLGAEIAKEFTPEIETLRSKIQAFVKSGDFKKLAKDFSDGLKNVFTIGKEIGKVVLPPLFEGLKFVAQNAKTLVPLLASLVAGFTALKVIKSITSLLTAFTSPLGAALALLGGAAAALGIFKTTAQESISPLSGLIDELHDANTAFNDMKTRSKEAGEAEEKQTKKVNELWESLQKITDANGKVKEGYEERAGYILNELNKALGTEYTMNGGIISQYKDMQNELGNLIRLKQINARAGILEDLYKENQSSRSAADKTFYDAEQVLIDASSAENSAKKRLEEAQAEVDSYKGGGLKSLNIFGQESAIQARNAAERAYKEAQAETARAQSEYDAARDAIMYSNALEAVFNGANAALYSGDYDTFNRIYGARNLTGKGLLNFYNSELAGASGRIKDFEDLLGLSVDVDENARGLGASRSYYEALKSAGAIDPLADYSGAYESLADTPQTPQTIVINQTNNFSREKSQYELFEAKQATVNAVKRVIDTAAAY